MHGGRRFLALTCAVAALAGAASAGQCALERLDCSEAACSPLDLAWNADATGTLVDVTVDGVPVTASRLFDETVVDSVRTSVGEFEMRAKGPSILLVAGNLWGRIAPTAEHDVVGATIIAGMPRRYSDYPAAWQRFSGRCEGLF